MIETKEDIRFIYHYKGIQWNGEQYLIHYVCKETGSEAALLPKDLEHGENNLGIFFLAQIRALRDYQNLTGITHLS